MVHWRTMLEFFVSLLICLADQLCTDSNLIWSICMLVRTPSSLLSNLGILLHLPVPFGADQIPAMLSNLASIWIPWPKCYLGTADRWDLRTRIYDLIWHFILFRWTLHLYWPPYTNKRQLGSFPAVRLQQLHGAAFTSYRFWYWLGYRKLDVTKR